MTFTVVPPQQTYVPPVDACAVASSNNPQLRYTSVVRAGLPGGSGTMSVSFSSASFSNVFANVSYGPNSTPESIAASIAALVSKNFYRYGLSAKAYGASVIYSGNTAIGTVNTGATGSSFTNANSSAAAAQAENSCHNAPPPPKSGYAVAYSSYIPVDHVYGADVCIYNSGSHNTLAQLLYNGNGFRNSYKTTQALSLSFSASTASGYFADTGLTTNYGAGSPYNGLSANLSSQDDDPVYYDMRTNQGTPDCYLRNEVGKADPSSWTYNATVNPSGALVTMKGESQNPISTPKIGSIKWNMTVHVDAVANTGYVEYSHSCYPAHQVRVGNTNLYVYPPPSNSLAYIAHA